MIPVSRIRELIGVRIDGLFATPCRDDTILVPVKILPRRYKLTHYVTLGKTILMPDVDDANLLEEDILVLSTPITLGTSYADGCPWARSAVKYGFKHRALLRLNPGALVLTDKGFEELGRELSIAVYFSHSDASVPVVSVLPYDESTLSAVEKVLDLRKPELRGTMDREYEEAVNKWLKSVRERLIGLGIGRDVEAVFERREGFIYDFEKDQLVSEVATSESIATLGAQTLFPTSGGRGPRQFYEFFLALKNKTAVDSPQTLSVYLGYNIYSAVIYIRASSGLQMPSSLSIDVKIADFSNMTVVWSSTYKYVLRPVPSDIYISPSIPFTSSRNYEISITLRKTEGLPYIDVATLVFRKIWDEMPIPQTGRGYQLLSTGIAAIRPRGSNNPPQGCLRARASDMLDPEVYGSDIGVAFSTTTKSISLSSEAVNGLYLDALYNVSPLLHIDIYIGSKHKGGVSGSVVIKVNGVTHLRQDLHIDLGETGYIGSTIPLGPNTIYGGGHMIIVEHTFPDHVDVAFYVDALIEYQYAPDVWRPDNYMLWQRERVQWFRLSVYHVVATSVLWRSTAVLDVTLFSKGYENDVRHEVYAVNADYIRGFGTYVSKPIDTLCWSAITEISNTIHEDLSELAWIPTYIGVSIGALAPESVASGVLTADILFSIYRSLMVRDIFNPEWISTPDGYTGCSWVYGLFQRARKAESRVSLSSLGDYLVRGEVYLRFEVNGLWLLRGIAVVIPKLDHKSIYIYYKEGSGLYVRGDTRYG